jgi:histidine kinase
MQFWRRRLFWKFFFSYFSLILIGMLVIAVVIWLWLPDVFNNRMDAIQILFSEQGINDFSHHMGGHAGMMMDSSPLFMGLFSIFNQMILEALSYGFVAALLISLLVSGLMSHCFVRPLQQMAKAADYIADGHYQERLPIRRKDPSEQDELERLGFRFNRMAVRLQENEKTRRQLIGDVSHELRTPLTVIKGTMEGLMDGVLTMEQVNFERMFRQTLRLERLVDDLQELSRIEADSMVLDLKRIYLNRVITEVADILRVRFEEKGVALHPPEIAKTLFVIADEDRLGQVVVNLLSNALRYTPTGGDVWITASEEGEFVTVCVKDTGIGISEQHLHKIFDRFYRVEPSRSRQMGGSGIGLTIAKRLVEAQDGEIWAESEGPGQGAVFKFTLPAAQPIAE